MEKTERGHICQRRIPTYVIMIPKRHGQTDGQTTYCHITVLCNCHNVSYRAVKTEKNYSYAVCTKPHIFPTL